MSVIAKPIRNEFTSFTKAVWFLLGHEGGRWTVAEILDRVKTTWPRNAARYQIGAMASAGLLRKYPPRDGDGMVYGATYAVTRACKIPRNLTLAEIEELTGIRFVEDACERATTA